MLPPLAAHAVLIDTYPPSLVSIHTVFSLQTMGFRLFHKHCLRIIAFTKITIEATASRFTDMEAVFPFSFVNFLKEMMSAAKAAKLDQFGTANYNTATHCSNTQLTSLVPRPSYEGLGTRLHYQLTYNRYSNWNTPIHIMLTQHISCHCSLSCIRV